MQRFLLLLPVLAFLTACNGSLNPESIANSIVDWSRSASAADKRSVSMDDGEMSTQQFIKLNYLAPGQSRKAMNTWAGSQYPAYVSDTAEWYRIPEQPGVCAVLHYSDGRYDNYTIKRCD